MPVLRLLFVVLLVLNLLALAAGQGWFGPSQPRGEPERLTNQIEPDAIILVSGVPAPAPVERRPARAESPTRRETARPSGETAPRPSETAQPMQAERASEPQGAPTPESLIPERLAETGVEARPGAAASTCIAYAELDEPRAHAIEQVARMIAPAVSARRVESDTPTSWWVRMPPAASRSAAEERVRDLRNLGVRDLFIVREEGPHQFAISLGLFRTESRAQQHLEDLRARRVNGAEILPRLPGTVRLEIRFPGTERERLLATLDSEFAALSYEECAP